MIFSFIDLFAGVGGFRIAFEKLGGKCVGFSEIDKNAVEVYQNNFNTQQEKFLGDITSVNNLPKVDIVAGGVPCQAWSVAGSKKGFDDPRGKLWQDCIRLVKNSKPKSFVFENVKGLYDPRNKTSLNLIISEFEKCGYDVFHKLLNAYDFGLPQNRDRIFIVGIDKKFKANFEFPKPLGHAKPLHKIFSDIKFEKKHLNKKNFLPRDLFGERVPAARNRFQRVNELNDFFIFCDTRNGHSTIHSWEIRKTSQKEKNICMTILKNRRRKEHGEWDGNPLSFKTLKRLIPNLDKKDLNSLIDKKILVQEQDGRYELYHTKNSAGIDRIYRIFLPQSEIFSTITATENRDYIATTSISGKNKEEYKKKFIEQIYLKNKFRLMTGREAARLQGFPETFKIHSNEKIAKKQFGNAVPTNVVYAIAKEILKNKFI
jgi:DNA (cytosine-5)-methyltransferase 1